MSGSRQGSGRVPRYTVGTMARGTDRGRSDPECGGVDQEPLHRGGDWCARHARKTNGAAVARLAVLADNGGGEALLSAEPFTPVNGGAGSKAAPKRGCGGWRTSIHFRYRKPGVAPRAHVQGGRARQDARSRVVNHSCSPNAGLRSNRILVALRNIGCGEEICYDYSTTMSEGRWTMQCRCGHLNCRSTVGDFHDLPTPRQQHYLPTRSRPVLHRRGVLAYPRAKRSREGGFCRLRSRETIARERSIAGVHVLPTGVGSEPTRGHPC